MQTDFLMNGTYICPRCTYTTKKKTNMVTHFKRKNICAAINNLHLTDDIKEDVLRNHIYHIPKEPEEIIKSNDTLRITINNFMYIENNIHNKEFQFATIQEANQQ